MFFDENRGLVGGDYGEIAVTIDAGAHWSTTHLPTIEKVVGFNFLADRSLAAITDRFSVFSTRDKAVAWTAEKAYHASMLQGGIQMGSGRSVWKADNGILFFCEAPTGTGTVPQRAGLKNVVPVRPGVRMNEIMTLNGRKNPARCTVPGVRLGKEPAGKGKTVFVQSRVSWF
jgi:hypothetical protein